MIRGTAASSPHRGRPVFQIAFKLSHIMNTFDPSAVRKAVAEFTPLRPQKFEDLIPAKEVILELRQKRASYRSIADLLSQHFLPTSKTAIAMFCHQVLGENVRPRRRVARKRLPVFALPNSALPALDLPVPGETGSPTELHDNPNGNGTPLAQPRGPRIAQIRKLNPQSNEKTDSHP
jgi:hypothetical protein